MIGPGGSKIPAGDVEWLQVGHVKLNLAWWTAATLCMDHPNEPGWWPDPLLPVSRFHVSPGFSQPVWINVYAKPGLAPGMYKGNITITSDEIQPVSVPVTALVRSFEIPKGAGNNGPIDPEKEGPLLKWNVTSGEPGKSWANLHGDGTLIYPGVNGPIGSIRLANIRDGLEDYEYLHKYARLCGSKEKARKACEPVTKTLETFTRKPSVLQGQRDRLALEIEKLSAVTPSM